ncbi:MAG: LamG domain-containing protein, partial [Verrucomicrobiota bacterium]
PKVEPVSFRGRFRSVAAVAAAVLVTFFLTQYGPWSAKEGAVVTATDGVAVLSRALSVEWGDQSLSPSEGDALSPGKLVLESGLAQIEFLEGASVILEGPAEFEILSSTRAIFHAGNLRAFVPEPAQGFTIEGPSYDAVDIGTEFAMSVDRSGKSEIHVIDGEVAVHDKTGDELELLTTGRAVSIGSDEPELSEITSDGSRFVDREAMLQMSDQSWQVDYASWRASREEIANHPDTLLYFDFEDHLPWDRQLQNRSAESPRGGIVGARWVTGRWPGKGALEFKRVTDRVRLNIGETTDSLTMAGWVQIGGLDRRFNSLFLTDGWDSGEPHWHIGNAGQLTFGIKDLITIHSEPILGPDDLGRWLHFAVTYDHESGRVTQFLNGISVASDQADHEIEVRFGPSEIGNWRNPSSPSAVRSFNGRFDEFLISKRAYSESEIFALFESGTPYR